MSLTTKYAMMMPNTDVVHTLQIRILRLASLISACVLGDLESLKSHFSQSLGRNPFNNSHV